MSMKKKYGVAVLLALSVGIVSQPVGVFAATAVQTRSTEITDPDNEMPAFASPEEALNAANLAEEAALRDDSLKTALNDLESAHDAVMAAVQSRDHIAVSTARQAMEVSEKTYMKELSEASGVAESDIYSMHDTGMEWGQIGHELGVEPDMLGLQRDRNDTRRDQDIMSDMNHMSGVGNQELSEATARNMESGWSSGHGSTIQAGIHEPGTGDDSSGMISGAGGMLSSVDRNDNHDSMGRDDHDRETSGGSMDSEGGVSGSSSDSSGNQSDHGSDMGSDNSNDRGSDMGGSDKSGSSGGSEGHEGGSEGGGSGDHEGGSEGHEGRE